MRITFWGTRGSTPSPGPDTVRYGGNTLCLSITTYSGQELIIDAGSGLRQLGYSLVKKGAPVRCNILLSHTHLDHVQGFPFFAPAYNADNSITVYGPHSQEQSTQNVIDKLMHAPFFPIQLDELPAKVRFSDFTPGDSFTVGDIWIETAQTFHPCPCSAFRITADGWSIAFCTDHEGILPGDHSANPSQEQLDRCADIERLLQGVDMAIVDAHYTASEYPRFRDWGHSAFEMWPEMAARAGVKHLYFIHHSPSRSDSELEQIQANMRHQYAHLPVSLQMAREGMTLVYPGEEAQGKTPEHFLERVNRFAQTLSGYKDVNTVLDLILREARSLTNAEAGTFYLYDKEKHSLQFSFTQNDKLFTMPNSSKHIYSRVEIPVSPESIAGYVALTKSRVNIADVYNIKGGMPFTFNDDFDKRSGYRTSSMLSVPFCALGNELVAVLQLINKHHGSTVCPFNEEDERTLQALGSHAVAAIERTHMARELLVRMLGMVSLHDPVETGAHVQRVGAYAAEIFAAWARKRGMSEDSLFRIKDQIYIAAMLHDIGKIGISDVILKKPGKLTPEEFKDMQTHCFLGGSLFNDTQLGMDEMAQQIVMHHHQKWDGSGYTGSPDVPILSGEDIPVPARITAVADVLDALCSPRCYKEAWPLEKALEVIQQDTGTHFDPSIVDSLLEIVDTIRAIQEKFTDEVAPPIPNQKSPA